MATVMRLKRVGAKKAPVYRVIITDRRNRRDGRAIEEIGLYNPISNPPQVTFKEDRVRHWLGVGAIPSETVRNLLKKAGLVGAAAAQVDSSTEDASA